MDHTSFILVLSWICICPNLTNSHPPLNLTINTTLLELLSFEWERILRCKVHRLEDLHGHAQPSTWLVLPCGYNIEVMIVQHPTSFNLGTWLLPVGRNILPPSTWNALKLCNMQLPTLFLFAGREVYFPKQITKPWWVFSCYSPKKY